jgi:hypothetical protein
VNESPDRTERIISEEEHLTTADLADAGHEGRLSVGGTPVGVTNPPHDPDLQDERDPDRSGSTDAIAIPSRSGGTATAAVRARKPDDHHESAPEHSGPLFSLEEAANLRERWDAIQVGFVDEPRQSVQQADSLVASTMKRLAEQFSAERSKLEHAWDGGNDVSTEDLRVALRRYRSFFSRLLNV